MGRARDEMDDDISFVCEANLYIYIYLDGQSRDWFKDDRSSSGSGRLPSIF